MTEKQNGLEQFAPKAMPPILGDRSALDRVATCPHSHRLHRLVELMQVQAKGTGLSPKLLEIVESAPIATSAKIAAAIERGGDLLALNDVLPATGTIIHGLVEEAFKFCQTQEEKQDAEGNVIQAAAWDYEQIPDYFVQELPKQRPDLVPEVIRAAACVADLLADLHVRVIGVEEQIDCVLLPEIPDQRGAFIGTTCVDILAQGQHQSLHVWDWKTGYKRRTNTEAKDDFQAIFIAYLLWQQPQYKNVNTIHFWFIETRWGSRAYARFDRHEEHHKLPHLTQEEAFAARISQAVRYWLTNCNDAWPEPKKCEWCDMIRFCKYANTEALEIAADPTAFLDRYVVTAELMKKDKATLTKWIKKSGPVYGTNVVFDKKPASTRFYSEFRKIADEKAPATAKAAAPGDSDDLNSHFG